MKYSNSLENKQKVFFIFFFILLILLNQQMALALDTSSITGKFTGLAHGLSITQMLKNLSSTWGSLKSFLTMFATVSSIVFFVLGLHKAVLVSQQKAEKITVFTYIFAAGMLATLPSLLDATYSSMGIAKGTWGGIESDVNTVFGAKIGNEKTDTLLAIRSVIELIWIVGLIAVIRGIFILKNLGNTKNGNNASLGKAIVHIIAGAMLMNIIQVSQIFGTTVGL